MYEIILNGWDNLRISRALKSTRLITYFNRALSIQFLLYGYKFKLSFLDNLGGTLLNLGKISPLVFNIPTEGFDDGVSPFLFQIEDGYFKGELLQQADHLNHPSLLLIFP